MAIPKIFHLVGQSKLNTREQECIDQIRLLHPDWEIKRWVDDARVPDARLYKYLGKAKYGAQRADLIRLDAVYVFGGVYLDLDMWAVRPLDDLCQYDSFIACSENGHRLTNAFFAAPPRHEATDVLIRFLVDNEPDWTRLPNETTGPWLFSMLLRYRKDILILPRESFYPYQPKEKPPEEFNSGTFAAHEWAATWVPSEVYKAWYTDNRNFFDRRILPILQPILQQLKKVAHWVMNHLLPPSVWNLTSRHQSHVYPVAKEIVVKTKYDIMMSLPGDDLSVVPSLALHGQFEAAEEAFVANIVKGGDWVIDVGANVGLFTMLAASRCGPFGRIFAIEADEELCNYIRRSSALMWFQDRIAIINKAASSKAGKVNILGNGERRGDQRIADPDQGVAQSTSVTTGGVGKRGEVECATLDSLFSLCVPIKLVKMDVEGHEVQVLRGATRLWRSRCVEYFMIEVSIETCGPAFHELIEEIDELLRCGYSLNEISADGSLKPADRSFLYPRVGHNNVVLRREPLIDGVASSN